VSFSNFEINERFLHALKKQKITEPTPIQNEAIPPALEGRDLVGIAQTGTGKTLAFALPLLTRLTDGPSVHNAMLVLTPTRELAVQVHDVIETFGKTAGLKTACIYGGVGMEPQTKALRRGCTIIVATPGRLLDHMSRGNVRFKKLSVFVLDEADRMLDMGFLPDIRRIAAQLPKDRQTLMFSATFPKDIERMANEMLHDPLRIEVGTIAAPVDTVSQNLYEVNQAGKIGLLSQILREQQVESALVFLRTKHRTDRVTRSLHKAGFKVQAIHGGRSQRQRQQALDGFRQGRYKILVATEVAARGLDIEGISHVINFDIPATSDAYIHRIGRTARASAKGNAITFVSPEEFMELKTIESALGANLPRKQWEGTVPVVSLFKPKGERSPKSKRSGSRRRRSLLRHH